MPTDAPVPPTESIWSRGSRTLTQASAETGFSREHLTYLCDEGELPWFAHSGKRTKIIAWGAIVDYLDGLHQEHLKQTASAGARTA